MIHTDSYQCDNVVREGPCGTSERVKNAVSSRGGPAMPERVAIGNARVSARHAQIAI